MIINNLNGLLIWSCYIYLSYVHFASLNLQYAQFPSTTHSNISCFIFLNINVNCIFITSDDKSFGRFSINKLQGAARGVGVNEGTFRSGMGETSIADPSKVVGGRFITTEIPLNETYIPLIFITGIFPYHPLE